ncbi:glutamate-5-semialdehyde dehydrogenase [bacterium]|nr:glutamate-5-semialdehyde dehydrogenase [bacterium]
MTIPSPLGAPAGAHSAALAADMLDMGARGQAASRALAAASREARSKALLSMSETLLKHHSNLASANARDMEAARARGLSAAMLDRLELTRNRITAMAKGVADIAALPDPCGDVIAEWTRPNGLLIQRVRGPIGVIGIIYESRPNVTADAGAICVRSGNAAILRGGSESLHSSRAIAEALREGLRVAGLPEDAIQLVQTADRAAVGHMLAGLGGKLDILVPRGGRSLVERVQAEARVPVIGHLEGLCHTFIHEAADPDMAVAIAVNAKMRRVGICGAMETLLIDSKGLERLLPPIARALEAAGCELRGDERARSVHPMTPAVEADWSTEHLAPILSVAVVDGVDGAMRHIARYGSQHTDAIVTENPEIAELFLSTVDSAIVLHNASTQFADGGEFGMGAEIGIATSRIHARGPVGAEQLTIFKYVVRGRGQTRP